MVSNNRPQFKHPIIKKEPSGEISLITADSLIDACNLSVVITQLNWNGLQIIVRNIISLDEMSHLIKIVLDQCWNGEFYQFDRLDFLLCSAVIAFYSNVVMPDGEDLRYQIIYGTDLYTRIKSCVSKHQIDAIENAVKMYLS